MVRTAPTIPVTAVGRKVWYHSVDGRKVTCVVVMIDSVTHPQRLVLRVTATKDPKYGKGSLISTPPAFTQLR